MTIPYLEKDSSDPSLPMNKLPPRRNVWQEMKGIEQNIQQAIWDVEIYGASPALTEAQNLLIKAKDMISDHIDGVLPPRI